MIIKIYFSQIAGLFSLAVFVKDKRDGSLVFHKVYPPHTVAQFSDHAIYNPDEALKDYALTISNLSHKCKNLAIKLQLSGPVTEKAPSPTCLIEFYGKVDEADEAAALANRPHDYAKGLKTSMGQSVKFYTHGSGGEVSQIPVSETSGDSRGKPADQRAEKQEASQVT